MASSGRKKENFSILEEIYHDDKSKSQPPKSAKQSVKDYFQVPKRIDNLLAGAILIFGLVAVALGFFQFKYKINKYFQPQDGQPISLSQSEKKQQDLLGLSQKDTDQDGLSDYDELYIYGSSPYLKDTDSDGITDAEEVAQRTDPNCPKGQNCFAIWGTETSGVPAGVSVDDLLLSNEFPAFQLRQLLEQTGVPAADLAQFSDEDLLEMYQQILSEGQAQAGPEPQTIDLGVERIEDLTPGQIRELLGEAGVSQEILDQITDAELMELVEETLVVD